MKTATPLEEEPAPAEDVTEPAAQEQQSAEGEREPLSTQEREAAPKPRSASILGRATFTTVASRMSISWAESTMAMPIAARPALSGEVAGGCGRVAPVGGECGGHVGEVLFWPGGPRYS